MAVTLRPSDIELARRLEAAEAVNAFSMAGAGPGIETDAIAGGCAMFAGANSPLTHAMGCGMNGSVDIAEIERLERFFFDRGADCMIDLCPMADPGLVQAVMDRGYCILEFNNLMVRPVTRGDGGWEAESVRFEQVDEATRAEWLDVVAEGFQAPLAVIENIPLCGDTLMVRREGRPVAAAGMAIEAGVALLFGDATVPASRAQGIQSALIRERVARAARAGCDLAVACVLPGSGSHRNYERAGFQLLYMRVNVKRDLPKAEARSGPR